MNVCFIGKHKYPEDVFSNEQDMKTWRSMAQYFDRLFVVVQSPDLLFHRTSEKNIRIYLVPQLGYFCFINCAVILGIYLKLRFGVDIFDASEVAGGGTAVTILKFLTGTPSVIEVQGEIFKKPENKQNMKGRLLQKIGRFAMKRAARIRVISHAIFNQVKEQGILESKIRLVSLRVDLDLFHSQLSTSDVGTGGDKVGIIKIGYLGRLVDGKGLEDLLVAMSNIKCQMSNVHLLIFGAGPLEGKLKKIAQDLSIEDKIEWRGFVPYSETPEAFSEIDIFVYPSWHEGFGRSIMEAMAMEKAVVATNVGGIPDLVKDGENGFLVPPHRPEMLAEKIEILIENGNLRKKFGEAGRKWVSENFEWNDGIKKFAELFLKLKQ